MKTVLFGGSGMIGQGVLRELLSRPEVTRVVSVGHVSYDLPLAAAKALHTKSPGLTFCFISGASTDATEQGPVMWARVKGATENALQKVGFKAVYSFRPGYIQPMDGIESKTPSYKWMYVFTKPLYPLFKGLTKFVTSTRQLGFAMVEVAEKGFGKPVLESADINSVK